MNETLFMGIDGGGSGLRIAITGPRLGVIASATGETANPNLIGREKARDHIHETVLQCLEQERLSHDDIQAATIGIAGASNEHSEDWLIDTVLPVLPNCLLVPSSDLEIALAGALGERHGILLLAGTGSAAFGMSPEGRKLQIGGWGYLFGDPGSGYWIGMQVLRQIIDASDAGSAPLQDTATDNLTCRVLDHIQISQPRQLIKWLYHNQAPPVAKIANVGRLTLEQAERGDWQAINILQRASIQLVKLAKTLINRLEYRQAPIAFAGGLLDHSNFLSEDVTQRLALSELPLAKYAPVLGAALIAKQEWSRAKSA